jgi:predicted chitinase
VQPEKFSAGMDDIKAWLPQILHECALLECLQENLNYSADRIVAVWPARFPSRRRRSPTRTTRARWPTRSMAGAWATTSPTTAGTSSAAVP